MTFDTKVKLFHILLKLFFTNALKEKLHSAYLPKRFNNRRLTIQIRRKSYLKQGYTETFFSEHFMKYCFRGIS